MTADPRRYTSLKTDRLYRYDSQDSHFQAEIQVDADGSVVAYPTLFRRVA